MRRILKILVLAVLVLVALPLVLTPLYRLDTIRPVSTPMIADALLNRIVLRDWRPLEDIAPVVPQSVLMSEDGQFCNHHGIDVPEMRAVFQRFLDGEETRGASTIPMQAVKNLFLWPGRSYLRKALELPLAIYLDAVLSKRRIMEIYLNVAEWDVGVYGIEAASQHYFGRPASELTRRQAALLAVTLPNPGGRNPASPSQRLNRLADRIERLSRQSGAYIKCLDLAG